MQFYDYILTGGGLASLSLALHMAGTPLREKRILILTDEAEDRHVAGIPLWFKQAGPFEDILSSWQRARVVSRSADRELDLGAVRYGLIRWSDFQKFADDRLNLMPAVERISGQIERIYDAAGQARVQTGAGEYSANWVFDGSSSLVPHPPKKDRYLHLKKQIKEWEIETAQDCFNPDLPTLFDARIPPVSQMRFMQILPFSSRHALIKFVAFTPELVRGDEIASIMQDYLNSTLQILRFDLLAEEDQLVTLTDRPFVRRDGFRVLRIGPPGGMVKPSTGLSFQRIQRDSAAICASLLQAFHPFRLPKTAARYRLFDSAMLQLYAERGERAGAIVAALLDRHTAGHLLRFLDEESARQEDLALLAGLPWVTLLQAAIRADILRKG